MRRIFFVLALAAAAHGHEIGTTRVTAAFPQGRTYAIEIVTDAGALVEKLEAASGSPPPADTRPAHLESLLSSFDAIFRQHVQIVFDGVEVRPDVHYAVAPPVDAVSAAAATIRLTGDLPAGTRQFAWSFGWTFASYALTIRDMASGTPSTQWLEGNQTSMAFPLTAPPLPAGPLTTIWRYLTLGFTHILPNGLDHMLFVLGIYLLSGRARSVLAQVSAFTVAHSITLGLSLYGLVSLPPRIVEPMIAVSIAYVAIENVFLAELKAWRVALVFAFGLLHGMGFAGALRDLALPRSEFLTALAAFNVGVEGGQLAVIGFAFLAVGWHCAHRTWYRSRIVIPASVLIACTAAYWTVERLSL